MCSLVFVIPEFDTIEKKLKIRIIHGRNDEG